MVSKAIEVAQEIFIETESSFTILVPSFISVPSRKMINLMLDEQYSKMIFLAEGTDHADFMRSVHSLYAETASKLNHRQSIPTFINATSSIIPSSKEGELRTLPSHDRIVQQIMSKQ